MRAFLFFFALVCSAQAAALTGVVKNDGAQVYSQPDFDAQILATLTVGQKVVVSKGTAGAYAKFHRVRAGKIVGYISEMDVEGEGGASLKAAEKSPVGAKAADTSKSKTKKTSKTASRDKRGRRAKSQKLSPAEQEKRERAAEERARQARAALPFVFNRYVGLVIGVAGYEETISASKSRDSLLVYGLKLTGPGIFFEGPILDTNVVLHWGAPKGYASISAVKPSGFFLLADTLLILPMLQKGEFSGTLGFGPAVSYRSFKTVDAAGFVSHSGFGLGLSLQAGAGVRLGDYALRLEGKYLVDKRIDTIFQLSLQNAF